MNNCGPADVGPLIFTVVGVSLALIWGFCDWVYDTFIRWHP